MPHWLLQPWAVSADCDAVANVVSPHHYVKTAEEAVAATLKAGMDVDCSYFVGQHGMSALKQGYTPTQLSVCASLSCLPLVISVYAFFSQSAN